MSIRAVKGVTPEWYTPASEMVEGDDGALIAPEGAARFQLRPLTQMQLHEVMPEVNFEREHITRRGIEMCLRYGLTDWQGVEDDDGAALPCTFENAQRLPYYLHQELASQMVLKANISEDDEKKS